MWEEIFAEQIFTEFNFAILALFREIKFRETRELLPNREIKFREIQFFLRMFLPGFEHIKKELRNAFELFDD